MITFDNREFYRAMTELQMEVGLEIEKIMNWQMSLWCADILKKIGGDPKISSMSVQKQRGELALYSDMDKLFSTADDDKNKWMNKDGDWGVKTQNNSTYNVLASRWIENASLSEMKNIHNQNRNNQGRVYKTAGENKKLKGKWYSMKYYVRKQQLINYIKVTRTHVGKTKSSWIKAYNYFNSMCGNLAKFSVPDWVSRWSSWGDKYSVAEGNYVRESMTGQWTAGSNVPWITDRDQQSLVNATGNTRIMDMQSGRALQRLVGIIEKKSAAGIAI